MSELRLKRTQEKKFWQKPGFYGFLIGLAILAYTAFWLFKFPVLPNLIRLLLLLVEAVLFMLCWWLMVQNKNNLSKVVGWLLVILLSIGNGMISYYFQQTYSAFQTMSETEKETGEYIDLYVLKDGVVHEVNELNDRTIGILKSMNEDQKNAMLDWLNSQEIHYNLKEYDSSLEMARQLKGMAIDGIILYQPYLSVIENYEGMDNFNNSLRSLHQIEWKTETKKEENPKDKTGGVKDITKDPFTVLISGIDTYGPIGTSGRSDVNMIITVNPTSHEVLLVSIPRDYYVEMNCTDQSACLYGQRDKLTHTGIFGIDTTASTLGKLFDTKIDYTVRINFDSLISVIDAMGGIDVNNVDTFTNRGYSYEPGIIHMDGAKALVFARERYAFTDGDRERGRNQMRVVEAILEKALSPEILKNYSSIINAVGDSVQMTLSIDDIAALASEQIAHPADWKIYSFSVNGTGATDFAPALGDNAYVMWPDENTVTQARQDIQAVENGEVPLYLNNRDSK